MNKIKKIKFKVLLWSEPFNVAYMWTLEKAGKQGLTRTRDI